MPPTVCSQDERPATNYPRYSIFCKQIEPEKDADRCRPASADARAAPPELLS